MRRNKAELAFALGDVNAEAVRSLFHAAETIMVWAELGLPSEPWRPWPAY